VFPCAAADKGPFAVIETSMGSITIKLFAEVTPNTVRNFIGLATGKKEWTDPRTRKKTTAKLYDGTGFHRVIPGELIQGGDPLGTGSGGPGYRIPDEILPTLKFDRSGRVGMANTGPNSGGSQFFITLDRMPLLNDQYTIFGQVVKGMDVVANISKVKRLGERPRDPVLIKTITIVDQL